MPVIKRYPNRKLYDTQAKRYITLQGIATLIRQGEELSVVDHVTGEDLTALTLSQVIFEQEKKQGDFVPSSVLSGLIQAGGGTLSTLRRILTPALDLLRQIDEEIERRVQLLVSQGELAEDEGLRLRDQLVALGRRSRDTFWLSADELERVLAKRGIPTYDDVQQIAEQLDLLAAKLDDLG
jgi:polyhydroxyalkanoate synthesis repressor PhaR